MKGFFKTSGVLAKTKGHWINLCALRMVLHTYTLQYLRRTWIQTWRPWTSKIWFIYLTGPTVCRQLLAENVWQWIIHMINIGILCLGREEQVKENNQHKEFFKSWNQMLQTSRESTVQQLWTRISIWGTQGTSSIY